MSDNYPDEAADIAVFGICGVIFLFIFFGLFFIYGFFHFLEEFIVTNNPLSLFGLLFWVVVIVGLSYSFYVDVIQ